MKTIRLDLLLFSLIILLTGSLLAQPFSTFEYRKGKNATVFAMENSDPEESFLMTFRFPSYFDLVFLDDDLHLKRITKTTSLPPNLWEKPVQGILNRENEVYVFMETGSYMNIYETSLFKINKEDGSIRILPLNLTADAKEEMKEAKVKLLKVFQFEDRFYKLWIDVKSSKLYVFYYEMGEVNEMNFVSVDIPIESLARKLGKRQVIPTPVITDYRDASLISNAKKEKIYMFDQEMLISVENEKTGSTDLVVINTENWEIEQESYPVPSLIENTSGQQFNSFIYGGYMYQSSFNSTGLHLSKIDFETKEVLAEKTWANSNEFNDDFGLQKMRQFRGTRLRVVDNPNLWSEFNNSLAIVLQPEEGFERLIIGSHRYMDQTGRDVLNTLGVIASIGASVGAGNFVAGGNNGNITTIIDPFESINYVIDAAFYFNEGRMFQGDCFFNPETFKTSSVDVNPDRWESVMERINEKGNEQRLFSVSIFERGDKIYFGYWRKKEYYLVEF